MFFRFTETRNWVKDVIKYVSGESCSVLPKSLNGSFLFHLSGRIRQHAAVNFVPDEATTTRGLDD